jgi:hypothetical protein
MTHFTKIATGLTGLAALAAVSSPAGAQMNPYGYGNNGGVVGAIVNAVSGYGQYPQGNYGYEQMGQRNSVEMCARTAEQRLNSDRRYAGYNNPYGQNNYNNGYGQDGYGNGVTFRVVGITSVDRRMNGALRVRGIASSESSYRANGWNDPQGDDQRNDYGNRYGNADSNGYANNGYRPAGMDYRFTCKIDSRGAVTSLNFDRGTTSARG